MNEKKLHCELGEKYAEYKPKVDMIMTQLKRSNKLSQASKPLNISLSNKKQGDLWMKTHEPFNQPENVLMDDNTVFRQLKPSLEFSLSKNFSEFYVAEIIVHVDEPAPGEVEIMLNNGGEWFSGLKTIGTKDGIQRFLIPDEKYAKYVLINFLNNIISCVSD